jgi:hypothetical protein
LQLQDRGRRGKGAGDVAGAADYIVRKGKQLMRYATQTLAQLRPIVAASEWRSIILLTIGSRAREKEKEKEKGKEKRKQK